MLREFRDFIARGNVLDLAVAVIIGAAFATITTSLTEDIIMPVVGALFGGLDFSSYFMLLGPVPDGLYRAAHRYAALKAAGAPCSAGASSSPSLINFLILAFIIFLLVRAANRMTAKAEDAPAEPPDAGRPCVAAARDQGRAQEARRRAEERLSGKVGSFCCSVLPVPPESASVARCGPNRAFDLVT